MGPVGFNHCDSVNLFIFSFFFVMLFFFHSIFPFLFETINFKTYFSHFGSAQCTLHFHHTADSQSTGTLLFIVVFLSTYQSNNRLFLLFSILLLIFRLIINNIFFFKSKQRSTKAFFGDLRI